MSTPSKRSSGRHAPSASFDDKQVVDILSKDFDAFTIKSDHKRSPSILEILGSISIIRKPREISHAKQNLLELFKSVDNVKEKEENSWKLDDFQRMESLGNGTFGQVLKCQHKETEKYYAMKIMKKKTIIELKQVQHTLNEKELQMELECPFIVKLYKTFQDEKNLYMIMEFVQGGELFTWLKRNSKFNQDVAKFFACEILIAMEFIHNSNCVYRDLKPENILIDKSGHLKIADFGFVKRVEKKTWSMIGTPNYLAPEILIGSGHDKGVDFWSFGILLYEMLVGKSPFEGTSPQAVFKNINEGKLVFPNHVHKNARDLIKRLLAKERHERIGCMERGIQDIKEHPFFEGTDWDLVANRKLESPLTIDLEYEGSSKYYRKETPRKKSVDERLIDSENELFKDF